MNFDTRLGGKIGDLYFKQVYQIADKNQELKEKGEHLNQQYYYCSTERKDAGNKNELLKITDGFEGWKNPHDIDVNKNRETGFEKNPPDHY